ncbi:patatin-like phospholipase family protein [Sabulicella rubraurantiaca]|uniref:patatin-like phospholipase family protein n=1 Tax=Sabulicella rubraurantiaca TaxID=2811429 RepID=UPI001A966CBA|nr:patatin-like phospholipase family protein [Sabulicella rubraurantiaca]
MDAVVTETRPRPTRARPAAAETKTVNLALQGGGAHGAFTWGVLDRLLEDERVAFEGISATSAGAMNAAVCAFGLAAGGRERARRALETFWMGVSDAACWSPVQPSWLDRLQENWSLPWSPAFMGFDLVTRLLSPYEFNPLNLNPLRQVLESVVDFELLRRQEAPVRLFLSATNVRTGRVKVFAREELSADAVLASACLPFLFHAVEIGGEAYWDGGYMGNPAIFPLIYGCEARDVVVVHINPMERPDVPRTARDILNRVNEISFNSSLMREMRAIHFVTSLIDGGLGGAEGMKRMLIHSISADDVMAPLTATSKLNADRIFLRYLHDAGRRRAQEWLAERFADLGERSSVDIGARYL